MSIIFIVLAMPEKDRNRRSTPNNRNTDTGGIESSRTPEPGFLERMFDNFFDPISYGLPGYIPLPSSA